jgi:predicted lipoprotein with Yx(FWY)xxD motif
MGLTRSAWAATSPGARAGRLSVLLMAGVSSVFLVGCGSSSPSGSSTSSTSASTTTSPTTTSSAASTPGSTGAPPFYEVSAATVKGLGTVLVDGQGFTLYLFVPDRQSGTSKCYGSCAQGWPPLLLPAGVTTPVAGTGVESSLLGTTRRNDGTVQITYNKWPLYTYVTDSTPGQATGQDVDNLGGLWYVLSPAGKEITTPIKH